MAVKKSGNVIWLECGNKPCHCKDVSEMPRNSFSKLLKDMHVHVFFFLYWYFKILFYSDPEPEFEETKEVAKNIADGTQENDTNKITKGGSDQDPGDNVEKEKGNSEPESTDLNQAQTSPENLKDVNETNESNENNEESGMQNSLDDKPQEPSPNVDNAASDVKDTKSTTDTPSSPLWTESKLRKEWRKFNLDLSPKVQKLNEIIYNIHTIQSKFLIQ